MFAFKLFAWSLKLLRAMGCVRKSCHIAFLGTMFANMVCGNEVEPSFPAHQWSPIQLSTIPSERVTETNAEAYFGPPYNFLAKGTLPMYLPTLVTLQEPSLYVGRTNATLREYRFTYLPSWHAPFVLRLTQTTNGPVLIMKAWSNASNSYWSRPPFVTAIPLTANQWDFFTSQISTNSFWEMKPYPEMPEVLDGAGWLLEALDHGRYHLVDRNTPCEGDSRGLEDFRRLCLILLNWAPVERGDQGFFRLKYEISKHLR